ncbi:MAG: hypothetical protein ACXWJN_00340, partial [Methyloceanibacter sp.]
MSTGLGPSVLTMRSRSFRPMSGRRLGGALSSDEESSTGSGGLPKIGASASTMSRAEVTSPAPCLSRLLAPAERGSSGLPGTAKTIASLL